MIRIINSCKAQIKAMACVVVLSSFSFAFANSVDDSLVNFSTHGPDCYADGTVVQDGECYALVWSADGVFEGLAANGEPVDPADKVVLVAAVAENGHCPDILFQIPAAQAAELAGGVYDVLLLDTRVTSADGKTAPRGTLDGRLTVLNGYGEVAEGIKVAKGASGALNSEGGEEVAEGKTAGVSAAAPAGVAQPRIKHIRLEGDNVFLTVENMPGFMRVQGGATVDSMDAAGGAVETDGGTNDVILVTPRTGSSGFFRVVRN